MTVGDAHGLVTIVRVDHEHINHLSLILGMKKLGAVRGARGHEGRSWFGHGHEPKP